MKKLAIAAAAISCCLFTAVPVEASLNQFCNAVKKANRMGISGAPGTAMAKAAVASQNGQITHSQYGLVWAIATESNNWSCKGIY